VNDDDVVGTFKFYEAGEDWEHRLLCIKITPEWMTYWPLSFRKGNDIRMLEDLAR